MKVLHIFFIALGLLTVAWAAPAGVGLAAERGPVQRDPGAGPGGRGRYVFVGGFGGGK
ncbi:MAG: hypothetical protein M9894_05160 [Planctomycetes bacterium]|nr:hypothetical protein [Planctomycetota bacterium]